jgi:ATP-binding cassette subfamily B protein
VILVVKDGRIEEKGTFEELLSANGFFKMLYDSQFEGCD